MHVRTNEYSNDKTDLEHVTDPGAGDGIHLTTAHPRSETELNVLAAPDAHPFIECAEFHEIVAFDGNCTTDQRRGRERQSGLFGCTLLVFLHANPRVPTMSNCGIHQPRHSSVITCGLALSSITGADCRSPIHCDLLWICCTTFDLRVMYVMPTRWRFLSDFAFY